MTSTTVKNNFLPPGLVSNLQEALSKKNNESVKENDQVKANAESTQLCPSNSVSDAVDNEKAIDSSKPIVLVTNGDGIDSPGLVYLVEALVHEGLYNVHVCAPQSWVLSFQFLVLSCVIYILFAFFFASFPLFYHLACVFSDFFFLFISIMLILSECRFSVIIGLFTICSWF